MEETKLIEAKLATAEELRKLGLPLHMTDKEFAVFVTQKCLRGEFVNKLSRRIYDVIQERTPFLLFEETEKEPALSDKVLRQLAQIPIDELQYHVPLKEYSKHQGHLRRRGFTTLDQIATVSLSGRHAFEQAEQRWHELIQNQYEQIIADWNATQANYVIPATVHRADGLWATLDRALQELIDVFSERVNNGRYDKTIVYGGAAHYSVQRKRIADILRMYYREGRSQSDIAAALSLTKKESVRKPRVDFVRAFFRGEVFDGNLRVNDEIARWLDEVRADFMFKPVNRLVDKAEDCANHLLEILDCEMVEMAGVKFLIPKDKKGLYSEVFHQVLSIVKHHVLPIAREEVFSQLATCDKLQEPFERQFVDNILACEELMTPLPSDEVIINYSVISSARDRVVRILYDERRPLSAPEIKDLYFQRYGEEQKAVALSSLKTFGIHCAKHSGTKEVDSTWHYGARRIIDDALVEAYVREHKMFHYEDIVADFTQRGLEINTSLRGRLLKFCYTSVGSRDVFCRREDVADFPQVKWRDEMRTGLGQRLVGHITDILSEREKITLEELYAQIHSRVAGTPDEKYYRQRVKTILEKHCGRRAPFYFNGRTIRKHHPFYELCDFSTLEKRGSH